MKNLMRNLKENTLYLSIFFLAFSLNSCSNDDDIIPPDPDPDPDEEITGSFTVGDQVLMQNTLVLENVTVGQDSWIAVWNEGTEEMVSEAVKVEEGTTEDIEISLMNTANLTGTAEGNNFEIVLYADNPDEGTLGVFDEGIDDPILDDTGAEVSETINVTAPGFTIADQTVENSSVIFDDVTSAQGGFITLQEEDGTIVGRTYVEAGTTTDVAVSFDEGYTYVPGQTYYPALYIDDPVDQTFTFEEDPATDVPAIYGFDDTGVGMNVAGSGSFVAN